MHLTTSAQNQAPRPSLSRPFVAGWSEYPAKAACGSIQAHRVIHQPVSVVSQGGAGAWLNGTVSGDQRRLTGSGSAIRGMFATMRCELYAAEIVQIPTLTIGRRR